MSGIPGLASVPLLGALFARNQTEAAQTDIVMTLTPHVVQRPEITEEDLRSFLIGATDNSAAAASDTPPTPYVPPAGRVEPPRAEPTPPRIEPIRPPTTPSPSYPPQR
jgi:general secretion pathway protein D